MLRIISDPFSNKVKGSNDSIAMEYLMVPPKFFRGKRGSGRKVVKKDGQPN